MTHGPGSLQANAVCTNKFMQFKLPARFIVNRHSAPWIFTYRRLLATAPANNVTALALVKKVTATYPAHFLLAGRGHTVDSYSTVM